MTSAQVINAGTLYVVATPIGNLADLSDRARSVLAGVDIIACEDTRHTQKLLQHLGLRKVLLSVHDHNESERIQQVLEHLQQGRSMALVSDAGTPLISDPGFRLVQALSEHSHKVVPVPGASAIITALSAAGLPTDRFTFEGFLPHKRGAREEKIRALVNDPRTLVFYESKHRIVETLAVMQAEFGADRPAVLARELTKTFETFYRGTLASVSAAIQVDADQQKGEFVVMVAGHDNPPTAGEIDTDTLFKLLLAELPPKKAAAIIAQLTGDNKKALYQKALELQGKA
ncbi:16S rRNA (cytidine(1402)-2'-O)-methyltransferase [Bacterioplanes sanyensis]|uniref:Ribosomal RNA small subunit methyltransferase I n=1 Tax=Bacterioplanes sanyensis TaxID=1249553 RepID=A0A222FQB8_9GAMM|nr:16S rRNA (cytidine(1402)-2'-O)-methyltransferase [Bacterioplanes sanyensis]ASP40433.1 16S rRNA (cytidine(1402)-2'-O)-methyltransferase [Bacterioplanes sanyensis]